MLEAENGKVSEESERGQQGHTQSTRESPASSQQRFHIPNKYVLGLDEPKVYVVGYCHYPNAADEKIAEEMLHLTTPSQGACTWTWYVDLALLKEETKLD